MTGQELVDLVTVLTGRNEGTKHLTRLNVAQRKMWSDYEWDFAIRERAFVTDPPSALTNFLYASGTNTQDFIYNGGTFFTTLNIDKTTRFFGRLYVPAADVFIKLIGPLSVNTAFSDGVILGTASPVGATFDANYFRIEYDLARYAHDPDASTGEPTRTNFSRLINAWVDGGDGDLIMVSPGEFDRLVSPMDYNDQGRPRLATIGSEMVQDFTFTAGTKTTTIQGLVLRVWPVPDASYRIHYRYHSTPDPITVTARPQPNDDKWHQALAFYAAYLTRLDDVDNTRQEFFAEYANLVDQMKWTYGVTPNATQDALGPRQIDTQRSSSGFKPW